jgi:hypothetical protein
VTGAWGFLGEAVLHWRGRHVLLRRSAMVPVTPRKAQSDHEGQQGEHQYISGVSSAYAESDGMICNASYKVFSWLVLALLAGPALGMLTNRRILRRTFCVHHLGQAPSCRIRVTSMKVV